VTNIAEVSGLSLRDTIARLRDSGLDSIPAAAPKSWMTPCATASAVSSAAPRSGGRSPHGHQLGMRTTAP